MCRCRFGAQPVPTRLETINDKSTKGCQVMARLKKGYVQVYTGNGKGKTTAAMGLTLRAVGAGFHVYIAQFIKMGEYSEIKALKRLLSDQVTIEQYGLGRFVNRTPTKKDVQIAQKGLERINDVMESGDFEVVILEEANIAAKYGIFPVQDLVKIIISKPENVELVITGRYASPRVIEMADLVTEMGMVKHYYQKGVKARLGIEK
jgi:cob(I)alamin adenosyltransferase